MDFEFGNAALTLVVLVASVILYLIFRGIGRRWVRHAKAEDEEKGARYDTVWKLGRRVIAVAIFVTAILLIFSIWDISMAPFVAVATVVAAAVGFGAQDVVKDVLAGFFIIAEDQFHVGDTISVAGVTGEVRDLQLRVTVLRDFEGRVHFIPNGQITVTTNYTYLYAQPVVDVGIAYKEDVDRAMAVMMEEMEGLVADPEWAEAFDGPPELFGLNELADSSVVIRARLQTTADDRWRVRREAYRRIKNRFDREEIEIPFPHVTVYYGDA